MSCWATGLPKRIINEKMELRVEQIYNIYEMPEGLVAAQPAMYG
jgi:hypothetical protein